jgi:exodeoxyribonuclease III
MPRRSSRTVATSAAKASPDEEEVTEQIPSPSPPRKRKGTVIKATTTSPAKKKKKTAAKKESPPKKSRAKKGDSSSEASKQPDELPEVNDDDDDDGATDSSPQKKKAKTSSPKTKKKSSPKKKAAADHQRITERGALPRLWDANAAAENDGSYTFRIASWNVAGLRAVMKKHPAGLADLCQKHDLDMLCLQETKLQEIHLDDPKLKLRGCLSEAGYDEYWSCSRAKKGYSGTAIFVKQRGTKKGKKKQSDIGSFFGAPAKKSKVKGQSNVEEKGSDVLPELVTPTDVSYNIIGKPIDEEGRTITLEFPFATITNVYVPNSGQKLERLDYRTKEWDKDFLAFHQKKESDRGLPVIWLGDLNIAHKAYDIWNDGAKHLAKQAGVTEQERVSFQEQLDAGYIDAFRKLHPEAKGHYSYWSQRAGNREPNQGLRLDYFVCSPGLFSEESKVVVRDSYMVPDQLGSDHAPVVLEIELKKD